MPIANYNTYKSKILAPYQQLQNTKVSITSVSGRMFSLWPVTPDAGAAPAAAAIPVSTTTGSLMQLGSAGIQRVAQIACSLTQSGYLLLVDRLSHQGGLSGAVITAQATNLPTAALTRYTNGAGVFMALEIYTIIGSTATTVTVSYTNSSGTAGRISEATVFGGTGFREVNRFIILPLQEGDAGVRSVQSTTVLATTGTAGNFGVTLFKPLLAVPVLSIGSQEFLYDSILSLCGNMPRIENNACLQWALITNAASSGILLSSIKIIEE